LGSWGEDVSPVEVDPYAQTLRFWAGASAKGRTKLHFFEGNLDGEGYLKILDSALLEMNGIFGGRRWTFQHDGAPAHFARKTNDWPSQRACVYPIRIKRRMARQVPTLNWIENLWGILQAKCGEGQPPATL